MPKDPAESADVEVLARRIAVRHVSEGLRAADLPGEVSLSVDGGDVILKGLSARQMDVLADRLYPSLLPVVQELREALKVHKIRVAPRIAFGLIHLGDLCIPDVDTLAQALGASVPPTPEREYYPDWHVAQEACTRLKVASESAIGFPLLGDLAPYCDRCRQVVTMELLPLGGDEARRLAAALTGGSNPAHGDA
ncbi:hypothetical protein [Streptomyces sp. NPDC014733]|uniref:hypothetical protein n=1 Tax=Streptomyces sp. NPDC014733 TaxID=3364885 RepID=UPI0036F7CC33